VESPSLAADGRGAAR